MFSSKWLRSLVAALVFFLLPAGSGFSQTNPNSPSPDQKPRKVKRELKRAYQDWKNKDVAVIITEAELEAFEKLETDDEREQFIQSFWRRRDPDPDTEENEFKEEHFERMTYANEHFTSGKPGWMTDRGRIYVKFGKPDNIESYPSGGPYQRLPHEGLGSTTVYPFERWSYRHTPGVGSGVEIEFVDPTGSGEYRLARSLNEKYALLHVTGAGQTMDQATYRREQDSPFAIAALHKDLDKAPEIKRRSPDGFLTPTPTIDENLLDLDIRTDYFRQSDGRVLTAFTIQIANTELAFRDSGGLQTARLNIRGRLTTLADRRLGIFEEVLTTTATSDELIHAKEQRSAYAKAFILEPGHYRLDLIARDVVSGATGIRNVGFQVPVYATDKLETSSLILASKLEDMKHRSAGDQFVIGTNKVIPNLSGSFRRGQALGVYMQVYNAGTNQTTLRPSVDVEYAVLKAGKEIEKQVEDWRGMSDAGQRLTLARLFATDGLAAGEYEIVIRVKDHVTGQALLRSAKFTVGKE